MGLILKENLKTYLKARRISQKKLAGILGFQPPTVAEWLSGKRLVPEAHEAKICEVLGVTMVDLCAPMNPFQKVWMESAKGQALLETLSEMTDDEREQAFLQVLEIKRSRLKLPSAT
jgi:transcriptional regulator with XRE-family HTH domain